MRANVISFAGWFFYQIWFGAILIINRENGLITLPVDLNFYVINGMVPDVDLMTVLMGLGD